MTEFEYKLKDVTETINYVNDLIRYFKINVSLSQWDEEVDMAYEFFKKADKLETKLNELYKEQEAIYKELLIKYL